MNNNLNPQVEGPGRAVSKCWGPKRKVEVWREPAQPLGISIVGGKVEMANNTTLAGIFIKNVVQNSPAGRTGSLSTGDRIVEVDGQPILSADQDKAVKAIANAGNPLRILVQSLQKGGDETSAMHGNSEGKRGKAPTKLIIPDIFFGPNGNGPTTNGFSPRAASNWSQQQRCTKLSSPADNIPLIDDEDHGQDERGGVWNSGHISSSPEVDNKKQDYNYAYAKTTETPSTPVLRNGGTEYNRLAELRPGDMSSVRSDWSRSSSPPPQPELIQSGLSDMEKQVINSKMEVARREEQNDWKADKRGTLDDDPIECIIADNKIVEKRVIARKSSIKSLGTDDGSDDEDDMSVERNWKRLDGEVVRVTIELNEYGLGISLAGHKERERMETYICGIHPRGNAFLAGCLQPGDQLLKVGDHYVWDRCHLNVTSIIKSYAASAALEVAVLRSKQGLNNLAVKPVTQFPLLLDDMIFESEEFYRFKTKRELKVHKGKQGLGIMIIEGQHKATGNGIFVSDIQEQSAAFHAGLKVGDMILAINTETFLNISYDMAVSVIKSLGGNVKMLVTNPKEEEEGPKTKPEGKTGLTPRREATAAASSKSPAKVENKPAAATSAQPETKKDLKGKVELKKEGGVLGISLVGGSDTPLKDVLVHEIYPDTPAAKSKVLKAGDRIIKVNDTDLSGLTHDNALDALRSAQEKVVLHYEHREEDGEVNLFQDQEITLNKKAGKGLGISLVGRRDGPGVFVSALVSGSVAETSGLLIQGDQIVKVNNIDLEKSKQDGAVAVLKGAVGDIKIKVRRLNVISKT